MVSYYWWEGEVERGEEAVMIVKTRASLAERVSHGGQGNALLFDAGDHGDAAGKRRPGLSRLADGGDGRRSVRAVAR